MAKRGRPTNTRSAESPVKDVSEDHVSGSDNEDAQLSLHSDALDEDSDDASKTETRKTRQCVGSSSKCTQSSEYKPAARRSDPKSKQGVSEKRTPARKKLKVVDDTAEDERDSDVELKDGQEVVGKVVEAPTTGWGAHTLVHRGRSLQLTSYSTAPDGQISQHTLDFLMRMRDPACNDRVWFKLHDSVYRRCEKEFKNFVEAFTAMLTEVDPQIPPLPPKDVIHRIYRDIRFSNDKTPYKTEFSASFSRSGRKGTFAFFKPGDESLLAAGAWCPAKNELNMIRNHIKHSSDRLREIISEPEFVAEFGEPRPHPKGNRQNVFGAEGELKTAPKGVDKNHKDIDLLKCRSLAVLRRFTDDQVLMGRFVQELEKVAQILRPFVHCLNDMMTLPVEDDFGDDDAHE
ncbi:hypothetical protein J3R82DRAFT_10623 [Butyriboletus roseoflavus]|nr:hypothetical protein J3R82DRAFT_10623 [Butyriboletus roseoflavus]